MKFLIDAQLPRRLAHQLEMAGIESTHTLDLPQDNRTTINLSSRSRSRNNTSSLQRTLILLSRFAEARTLEVVAGFDGKYRKR